ncbi:MAG TPA: hypothetical protein VKZ79_07710 [Alphaproteobacteria bacterium]|nr:hypothetical protein [Alphaproteobacteria bacterium]
MFPVRKFGAVRGLALSLAGLMLGGLAAGSAQASETRGYVVSWFHRAAYSQDGDCPGGLNPLSEVFVKRILTDMGKSPETWAPLFKDYPANMYGAVVMRGKIDGKPANVYVNPTSVPDPQIHTVAGKYAYGFNLDGKGAASPNGFEDPETHEQGVNNQLFRALGCFVAERGTPTTRPTWPAIEWDAGRDQMPAWIIEISGIDSIQNSDNVTVRITRATGPTTRNASGDPQADMTYRVDPNPRMQNVVHARIKDGVLTTDRFNFDMLQDPVLGVAEYIFKDAKLRLTFNPDGSIKGILGGYTPWKTIYVSLAVGGSVNELNLSIDMPGSYYALRRLADAYPDPKTGENTMISAGYRIEAVPAFLVHPQDTRVSQATGLVPVSQTR